MAKVKDLETGFGDTRQLQIAKANDLNVVDYQGGEQRQYHYVVNAQNFFALTNSSIKDFQMNFPAREQV